MRDVKNINLESSPSDVSVGEDKIAKKTKAEKGKKKNSFIVVSLLLFLGFILFFAMKWIVVEIKGVNFSQIVFNLLMPMDGSDNELVKRYFRLGFMPAAIALIIVVVVIEVFKRVSVLKNRLPRLRKMLFLGAYALLIVDAIKFYTEFRVKDFLDSQFIVSKFIENNYVDPSKAKITFPEKKRNLVYIYLESLETTFADESLGGAFEFNIIPGLTEIALDKDNISFSNTDEGKIGGAYQSTYSAWTIASFFGQTTGLPFKLPIEKNAMEKYKIFMPGAYSIGEILKDNGYSNYIVQGSRIAFGGTKNFVDSHGEYTYYDYNYAKETGRIPMDYRVFWGMEDVKLFDLAKDKLKEVAAKDEPFNFTVFTIDSHYPNGYICERCGNDYATEYENAIACSANQVVEFVNWIKEQDFYDNTTIILTGDHYTMSKEYGKVEDNGYKRHIYNAIINSAVKPEGEIYNRVFNVMDMYPTTLAAIGAKVEGDRLGLGTNLFSKEKTLAEKLGADKFEGELSKKSSFFDNKIVKGK